MKINICSIKKNRSEIISFSFSVPIEKLLDDEIENEFRGNVVIDGNISNVGECLLVNCKIGFKFEKQCARCLEIVERNVDLNITEEFFSEMEDNCGDYTFGSEFLNIEQMVKDAILLEEPVKVLCKGDCLGICPVCGINLNTDTCTCDVESIDPRLAALKNIFQ